MNHSFRVIFQAATGTYTAVSELTKSNGKTKSSRTLLSAAVAGMLALGASAALASESCVLTNGSSGIVNEVGICVLENPLLRGGSDGGSAPGNGSVALGPSSVASGVDSTSIGAQNIAAGVNSTALGNQVTVNASGAIGIGGEAGQVIKVDATSSDGVAIGSASTVTNSISGIALGNKSHVTGATNGVAIGDSANASAANSVALGANSVANTANTISVGATASERKIVNVAAGTHGTDVANIAQLTPALTALGATINPTTGAVTGPTYALNNGGTTTTVGAALAGLDTAVTNNTTGITNLTTNLNSGKVGLVQQTAAGADITVAAGTNGTAIDFAGTGATTRTLKSVAAGTLGASSTEAVNGAQLFATNTRLSSAETSISTLQTQIGDVSAGGVQYDDVTTKNQVTLGGTGATRAVKLSNVANGTTASDAANFGQMTATSTSIASALGGGSAVNADGTITAPTYTLNGVDVAGGVAGAFTSIDNRVVQNTTDINTLAGQIGSGTVGLVQQAAAGANLTVGAGADGTAVDFTNNSGGARTLTGIANGVNAADAVNFSQLTATNNNLTALDGRVGIAETNITSINTTLANLGSSINGAVVYNSDKSSVMLGGVSGTMINNLSAGLIGAGSMQAVNGGQLFDMQTAWDKKLADLADSSDIAIGDLKQKYDDLSDKVDDQGQQLGDLDGRVGGIETGIADGSIGGGGVGNGTNPAGDIELGNGAVASGDNSSAIGSGATASGDNSTAVGGKSSATGADSTALGANSSATGNNSVAIGAGSVADRDNSVSFGSTGNERQLTNVADGTEATDAVNKRQLDGAISGVNNRIDQLDRRVDEMGAISSAQAQMAMSTAGLLGNNRLGVGVGYQNGQSALALGYQHVYAKGSRTLNFGGATSTRGTVSVGAGAGFSW
ncbi:ESPR-type extended signal peptide-containing protein [Collimonas sp. NPDC087041]|uniref:ESPR-type extended signal peptide-containing protein n=1 Tax=Collimonas sp. NPDC087041 TaxID=3363960 RepID=UPI0037F86FF0